VIISIGSPLLQTSLISLNPLGSTLLVLRIKEKWMKEKKEEREERDERDKREEREEERV
jgi:hypothetical protein